MSHDNDDENEEEGTTPRSMTKGGGTPAFRVATTGESALSDETREWVEEQYESADAMLSMERVRREKGATLAFLNGWCHRSDGRKKFLRRLVESRSGLMYVDLSYDLGLGRRVIRRYVSELEEWNVVERGGNPVVIRFTDDDHRLLATTVAAEL